jgi:hypothetical protein
MICACDAWYLVPALTALPSLCVKLMSCERLSIFADMWQSYCYIHSLFA